MSGFRIQSWNAVAPGLNCPEDWRNWLQAPYLLDTQLAKIPLKQIPPLLRRRFTELGRCAAGAALPLLENIDSIPSVFASRHGDTPLTLSLLEGIAEQQPMSPTGFSLAVHNAVSGLLSIARKDVSEVTAIAASEQLIAHALMEAMTQLQEHERVLCLIYDVPLPELYQPYVTTEPFPFALAMILSRGTGECFQLGQKQSAVHAEVSELMAMMKCLCGLEEQVCFSGTRGSHWQLCKADPEQV
ncbi:beta-ketoacyl synthase chain length factor [Marinobacterium stanieri]|uniref:beta-ketoacyl synthase chain length factor n=1 Tax=Marinobacterium stanieri TaxID=49186 RepID=UPI0013036F0C|nr:beta-ketoacyl synthase chain length factor [Marinobacterium stanieri]